MVDQRESGRFEWHCNTPAQSKKRKKGQIFLAPTTLTLTTHLTDYLFISLTGHSYSYSFVGVRSQPTNLSNQPDPAQFVELGRFLRLGGLSWVAKFFFYSGSGLGSGHKISNPPNPTRPTNIFNIYLKYII